MKFFKERKLRIDILTAFSLLVCITVICEILYSTNINKKLILDFEKEYYSKNISKSMTKYFDNYLSQIEITMQAFADHFDDSETDKFRGYDKLFSNGIKNMPYVTSFYIGLKNGTYFQLRTLEGLKTYRSNNDLSLPVYAKYALKRITDIDGKLVESWQYMDENFVTFSKEKLPSISFLANKRDWYLQTEIQKKPMWSNAYIFSTTKLPGITLSIPLGYYKDNSAMGVISVDISLYHFSELLRSIKMTDNSESYLISEENEIVASSSEIKTFEVDEKSDNLTLIKTVDIDNSVLKMAAKNLINANSEHTKFNVNGVEYTASLKKLNKLPFYLISIAPQSDFTSAFEDVKINMFLISAFLFLLSFGIIFWLSKRISTPISALCKSAKFIGEMRLNEYPEPPKSNIIEIRELSSAMDSMKLSISTFAKYAPKDLVRKLVKKGEEPVLGGMTKEITIFFSDIEKFSTVSEKLPAEYLILHLSEYFDEMTKEIMKHNGVIDKYIGDAVMAIWGAPNPDENQVINACNAALDCQKILEELKEKWAPLGKPPLPTRIGIHTGQVIVGNIGSQDRMNFTAIGDSVNIASRLEGANKYYGTKILVSESVEAIAKGRILFRVVDKIAVKGRNSGIVVYEPLCSMKDADDTNYYQLIDLCAKAKESFELYQNQKFEEALKHYKSMELLFPNLNISLEPLIKKCEEFIKTPPIDWDGTNHLTGK